MRERIDVVVTSEPMNQCAQRIAERRSPGSRLSRCEPAMRAGQSSRARRRAGVTGSVNQKQTGQRQNVVRCCGWGKLSAEPHGMALRRHGRLRGPFHAPRRTCRLQTAIQCAFRLCVQASWQLVLGCSCGPTQTSLAAHMDASRWNQFEPGPLIPIDPLALALPAPLAYPI